MVGIPQVCYNGGYPAGVLQRWVSLTWFIPRGDEERYIHTWVYLGVRKRGDCTHLGIPLGEERGENGTPWVYLWVREEESSTHLGIPRGEEREINNEAKSGPCSPMVGRGVCTTVTVSSHGG